MAVTLLVRLIADSRFTTPLQHPHSTSTTPAGLNGLSREDMAASLHSILIAASRYPVRQQDAPFTLITVA